MLPCCGIPEYFYPVQFADSFYDKKRFILHFATFGALSQHSNCNKRDMETIFFKFLNFSIGLNPKNTTMKTLGSIFLPCKLAIPQTNPWSVYVCGIVSLTKQTVALEPQ